MTGKLFRSSVAVSIATMVMSVGLFFGALYQYFGTQMTVELTAEGSYLAQGMNTIGAAYLDGLDDDRRITWIDATGEVLYDNWTDENTMENHLDREEIQEALSGGEGESTRWSSTLTERTLYAAIRLDNGSVIRIATTQDTVFTLLSSLIRPMLLIIVLCIVLSAVLALRLVRSIMRPILAIDLEHPENSNVYDELAPLLGRIKRQNSIISRQITQLKHAQQEFSALTNNMSEGFCLLDRAGHLLSYNKATLKLLGAAPLDEGQQHTFLALDRSPAFREAVESALAGESCTQELERNGRLCRIMANPVLRDEHYAGAVVVILDITARRQAEEMRREFTANVSHELKTPLTSISGIAEIMKNGLVRPDDIADFANDIYTEAQRLISLVGDILRLSQLDEGAPQVEKENIDLYDLAQQVMARMDKPAQKMAVKLSLEGESATISGSRKVLDEMLGNLVDNAIKYNREGGSVNVCVAPVDGKVKVTVQDTGVGIPERDWKRVFERFYRVDKSHSKAIGGTGLGLSIVKHGAAYHNAEVSLVSKEGEGTTVTLLFAL